LGFKIRTNSSDKNQKFVQFEAMKNMEEDGDFHRNIEEPI